MRNEALKDAPRDRRILVLNKTWAFVDFDRPYKHTGEYWVEAWWDGKEWRIWCGNKRTQITEGIDAVRWAELPA